MQLLTSKPDLISSPCSNTMLKTFSSVIEIAKKDMKQTEVIIVNVLIALCVAERK